MTDKKMVINWFSNAPWSATGYGNQTRLFVPRIAKLGYKMSITAYYGAEGSVLNWNGFQVYPKFRHLYGQDVISAHAVHSGANAIISLMDAWVIQTQNIKMPWFPWFPIDHEPIPPEVFAAATKATKAITMSKFGQKQAEIMGLDTYYIPHGVETNVFKPINRTVARKMIGLPKDAFVVSMVAANKGMPPRKAFFQQISAFAMLHVKHPDTVLYLHTEDGITGGEAKLDEYIKVVGLKRDKDVFFCDQHTYTIGFNDEYMNAVYNASDVLMNASLGEGFGIPIVEAQAAGCPVIVGDWTSMGELCFSGWKIPKSESEPTWTPMSAFQYSVLTPSVYERLERAYSMKDNFEYRKRARTGAVSYDADKITEKYWKPALEDMEARIV